jgi:hypothetical protein
MPKASQDAHEWFTPGRFAVLLAALTCAAYPDVLTSQGTFFYRDFSPFGYPLAYYHRQSFWRGEIPLWNPFNYCGLPFLAQWNTMTLYPFSPFYLLPPLSWSLGVFCLGHLFLGGMGMYFLAHRWADNWFAAAAAGLAYSFNALMLNSLMWPNNIAALGWLPCVVLAAERAWREGGRWLLAATLAGAMQMLAGAPEVILLTWILLATLLLGQVIVAPERRWRMAGRFLLTVLWVAGLAAAQLLPFLDLLIHSQRDKAFGDSLWSMPLWGWANLLVPLYRTFQTPLGPYTQPDQYWISSYYLGVGVLALALLAVAQVRRPRVLLLGALTLLCLLLALGNHGLVYSGLKRLLPGLGFMRYPIKFVVLSGALVPLLAAIYLGYCQAVPEAEWPRQRRGIVIVGVVLLGLIALLIGSALQYRLKDPWALAAAASGLSRVLFLTAILGGIIAVRQIHRTSVRRVAQLGVLVLLWLDAMTAGPRPNPTVPRWVYQPNLLRKELHLEPTPAIGESRLLLDAQGEKNVMYRPMTNGVDQVLYQRLALYANLNLLDDIPKVDGIYSLFMRELGEVFPLLERQPQFPSGLADFLALSHINAPGKVTEWEFRPTHLPWVTAGQKPVFADAAGTLSALAAPEFDPRRTVFLPPETRAVVTVANASPAKVSVRQFLPHKVQLEVEASEAALVVIAQSFYHNWQARVDDRPVRLLRANHAFQALQVPAGRHQVTLEYADRMFCYGARASLLSTAIWVALWIWARRRPQRPSLSGIPGSSANATPDTNSEHRI